MQKIKYVGMAMKSFETYLGGGCWEWLGRLCERRGGDTRYPGEGGGFRRANSQHPANLNRATAIPGPTVTLLHLITCRLEVNRHVMMWKRGLFTTSKLVSLLWVDLTPLKFVDEGQKSSSG